MSDTIRMIKIFTKLFATIYITCNKQQSKGSVVTCCWREFEWLCDFILSVQSRKIVVSLIILGQNK